MREKVVDYTSLDSLYIHLATKYDDAPFDAIIDCVGDENLYKQSPAYLKSDGKFLSITGGWLPLMKSKVLPRLLGGTPRSYLRIMNSPSGKGAREVAAWLEKGWVKEVPIDTIYDMKNALEVSRVTSLLVRSLDSRANKLEAFERLATKRAKGKIIVRVGE